MALRRFINRQMMAPEDLMDASSDGDLTVVLKYLDSHNHKLPINCPFNSGSWSLYHAARAGHTEIVKALLKAGAHHCCFDSSIDLRNFLPHIALCGYKDILEALLDAGIFNINAQGDLKLNCNTPLMMAALGGHTEMVQMLLERNAIVNTKNHKNQTALSLAASHGHADIVTMLKTAGATMESTQKRKHHAHPKETSSSAATILAQLDSTKGDRDALKRFVSNGETKSELVDRFSIIIKNLLEQLEQAERAIASTAKTEAKAEVVEREPKRKRMSR